MEFIVAAIAGACFNRLRGSGVSYGKTINDVAFGVAVWLTTGRLTSGALGVLAMAIGRAPGWGRYIGAMHGWETEELKEWEPIDWLIKPLRHDMVLWGTVGLCLRGMFWGACLSLATGDAMAIPAGCCMALCYMIGHDLARESENRNGTGWEISEYLFGALLWGVAL